MINLFLDSDVIIDALIKRDYPDSVELINNCQINKRFKAFTTPLVIANCYYLITKLTNPKISKESIVQLRSFVSVVKIDQTIIDQAISSEFKDFEDGIEFFACLNVQLPYLVTRNIKDYPKNNYLVEVITPKEALAL